MIHFEMAIYKQRERFYNIILKAFLHKFYYSSEFVLKCSGYVGFVVVKFAEKYIQMYLTYRSIILI